MPDQIHHSEEVDEILSRPPSWMLRWGLSAMLVLIIMFIIGTYYISYPNVISANCTITTEKSPITLKAFCTGRVDTIFVEDGAEVQAGSVIALIESPEKYEDVLKLKVVVDSILTICKDSSMKLNVIDKFIFMDLQLGTIQNAYTELSGIIADHLAYLASFNFEKQKDVILEKRAILGQLIGINEQQNVLLQEEIKLSNYRLQTDSFLFDKHVLSLSEYNNSKVKWIDEQNQYRATTGSFISNEMQYTLTKEQENGLVTAHGERLAVFHASVLRKCYEISSLIDAWKLKYLVASPTAGIVSVFDLENNQSVDVGNDLAIVTPSVPGSIIGEVLLPMKGSFLVKVGQQTKINISGYPYNQYGFVTGKIKSISTLPKDSVYHVQIVFPHGLRTSIDIELEYQPLMTGSVEIITEKRSLLDRIFSRLLSLFD